MQAISDSCLASLNSTGLAYSELSGMSLAFIIYG